MEIKMTYTAIVSVDQGVITKYAEFETEQEAQSHVNTYGGFVYNGAYNPNLEVGPNNTVAYSQSMADEKMAGAVRMKRNALLAAEVDPIASNMLRWAELTAAEQNAWAQYRTDLLNITDQAGFPHNVTWPITPEGV